MGDNRHYGPEEYTKIAGAPLSLKKLARIWQSLPEADRLSFTHALDEPIADQLIAYVAAPALTGRKEQKTMITHKEYEQLTAQVNRAQLSVDQEIAVYEVAESSGYAAAVGRIAGYKARYKADLPDAEAADDEVTLTDADIQAIAKAVVAMLQQSSQKPVVSSKLTDSGRMSALPSKAKEAKRADPYQAAQDAMFGPDNPRAQPAPSMQEIVHALAKQRPEPPKDPVAEAIKNGGNWDLH